MHSIVRSLVEGIHTYVHTCMHVRILNISVFVNSGICREGVSGAVVSPVFYQQKTTS